MLLILMVVTCHHLSPDYESLLFCFILQIVLTQAICFIAPFQILSEERSLQYFICAFTQDCWA